MKRIFLIVILLMLVGLNFTPLIGATADENEYTFSRGVRSEETWVKIGDKGSVYMPQAVSLNDKIYLIGGWDGIGASAYRTFQEYSPDTSIWISKTSMPTARAGSGIVAWKNKIIVIGGYSGSFLSTVEIYDFDTESWHTGASMPTPRTGMSVGLVNDKIYVIGGHNQFDSSSINALNIVEIYNPQTNTWSSAPNFKVKITRAGTAVVGDTIYLFGGYDGTTHISTVWAYSPLSNYATVQKTNMPTARYWPGVATINNKLCVIGGEDKNFACYNVTEVYNPAMNNWVRIDYLPKHTVFPAVTVVNNKIYSMAGFRALKDVYGVVRDYEYMTGIYVLSIAATAPSAPTNFEVTTDNVVVTLSWAIPDSNGGSPITEYVIYKGTTSGALSELDRVSAILTYIDTTVVNDLTYYYQVSASNNVREGPKSVEKMVPFNVEPPAPDFNRYFPRIIHSAIPDTITVPLYYPVLLNGDGDEIVNNNHENFKIGKFPNNYSVYSKKVDYNGYEYYMYALYRACNPQYLGSEIFFHEHDVNWAIVKVDSSDNPVQLAVKWHNKGWRIKDVNSLDELIAYSESGSHELVLYLNNLVEYIPGGIELTGNNVNFVSLDDAVNPSYVDNEGYLLTNELSITHVKAPWLEPWITNPEMPFNDPVTMGTILFRWHSPITIEPLVNGNTISEYGDIEYYTSGNEGIIFGIPMDSDLTFDILGTGDGVYTLEINSTFGDSIEMKDIQIKKGYNHKIQLIGVESSIQNSNIHISEYDPDGNLINEYDWTPPSSSPSWLLPVGLILVFLIVLVTMGLLVHKRKSRDDGTASRRKKSKNEYIPSEKEVEAISQVSDETLPPPPPPTQSASPANMCAYCGMELSSGASFCGDCGRKPPENYDTFI